MNESVEAAVHHVLLAEPYELNAEAQTAALANQTGIDSKLAAGRASAPSPLG
ncbi:MAG: hypothetical protein ACI81V_000922 [Lentimonas sp.]|jgi:hypothetical protein